MLKIKHFTFNPIQENTYVIYDQKGACAIIDPGCYFENERRDLLDFISTENLVPKCLLNTHCHLDHIFGNKFIAETFGLQLQLHRLEKQVLDRGPDSGERWGMPFENYTGELIYLEENSELEICGEKFTILFTPGHSPGSISFYNGASKMLIAGDVLFREGIGRSDLPGGDYDTLINSINSQLFILPEDTIVYPGHGPTTLIGYEKKNNPFLNQAAR